MNRTALHTPECSAMNHDESEKPLRYRGPSLEDMGIKPEDCGTGHPHIDAGLLDMCRLIVEKIDADPKLFAKAHERLDQERKRRGNLSRASREWSSILERPWPEIRAILLDVSDEGQRLRSSHPFKGIITQQERLEVIARHPPPGAPPDWTPPAAAPPEVTARLLADTPLPR